MRMTPLEIQSHRFGRRMNGLDRDEVETFLRMVSEDYEEILKENELAGRADPPSRRAARLSDNARAAAQADADERAVDERPHA